jgi:hypothetical protein
MNNTINGDFHPLTEIELKETGIDIGTLTFKNGILSNGIDKVLIGYSGLEKHINFHNDDKDLRKLHFLQSKVKNGIAKFN